MNDLGFDSFFFDIEAAEFVKIDVLTTLEFIINETNRPIIGLSKTTYPMGYKGWAPVEADGHMFLVLIPNEAKLQGEQDT